MHGNSNIKFTTCNTIQDRQSIYDATLKRVPATIVAGDQQIIITYGECVFVVLVIQHAMRMRQIVICGLRGTTVFFHIIS